MVVSHTPCPCPAQLLTMAILSTPPLPCPPHRNGVLIAGLRIVGCDGDLLRWTAQVWAICRTLSVGIRGNNDDHEQRPCALHVILSCLRPAGPPNPASIQQNSIDAVPHFCSKWLVPSMPPLALSSAASPSPLSFCPAPPSLPSPPRPDVPRSPSPLLHLASGQLHGLAVLQGAGTDLRALRYRCGRTRAFRSTVSTCTPLMHALEATPFSRCPTESHSYSPPCACEPSL